MTDAVHIAKIATGVPGFDEVLGGGLPEFSFNLIAGAPGCGKTTLAHQFAFANATEAAPAIYFTVLGEPPIKMLRYQQQFSFFDASKVGRAIRFVNLGKEMAEGGLARVLARIQHELESDAARIIIVDSFRALGRDAGHGTANAASEAMHLDRFVQRLALTLTSHRATTFLVGEYAEREAEHDPVFTVADGIFWLHQTTLRNSVVRRLQIVKVRGQEQVPGLHTMKIGSDGVRVFPRIGSLLEAPSPPPRDEPRKKTGVDGLDAMLEGGIPAGFTVLVGGPSGSGKSTLCSQFLLEGAEHDEHGVIALFEKRPEEYLRTNSHREELERLVADGKLELVYVRPLDLSVDEALEELRAAVARTGATRVVIDSMSGFEIALAPTFQEDFRESLYRLVGALTGLGATVLTTAELPDSFTELRLGLPGFAFLTDGIILLRYIELDGALQKVMTVAKMRGTHHSHAFHAYDITDEGIAIAGPLTDRRGIVRGVPVPIRRSASTGPASTVRR